MNRHLPAPLATIACVASLFGLAALTAATAQAKVKPPVTPPPAKADANDPNSQPTWGDAKNGIQTMLTLDGEARVCGRLVFNLSLRGAAAAAVKLPAAGEVSCWLMIGQGPGENMKVSYSEQFHPAKDLKTWPADLAEGKTVQFKPIDLSASKAFPREVENDLVTMYATGVAPSKLPQPVGKLTEVLDAGKTVAIMVICLPHKGEEPLTVSSNKLDFVMAGPRLADMPPEKRKAFVADLIKKFDKDAASGQAAHATAVQAGKDILPDLIAAVKVTTRPETSRLWLATSIADIVDPRAAEALIGLLKEEGGVTQVIAYHGPKQKDPRLDRAIVDKALASKDAGFISMAMLGFMVQRGLPPEPLIKAGLESPDAKVRFATATALGKMASDEATARLRKLSQDKDPRVRDTAKKILETMNAQNKE